MQALIETDDRQGFEAFVEAQKAKYPDKKKDIGKLNETIERNWESLKDYRRKAQPLPGIARGLGNVEKEDTEGYFRLIQQMIEQVGIPMSVYSDRHTIFRSPNDKQTIEQELAGEPVPLSQFGHALEELGVTHIKALTPQAKGR